MCVFDREQSIESFGKIVESDINSIFENPIRIEYECVYLKFLLVMKKRYVGLKLGNQNTSIVIKGIETRRRDNFPILRNTIEHMIEMFLKQNMGTGPVINYIQSVFKSIENESRPIQDYIITKEIKSLNLQPQVVTARKMEDRDPGYGPKVGERVNYVITSSFDKSVGISERADDPNYVVNNGIALCKTYYIEKIKRTIAKTFSTIFSADEFKEIGIDKKKYKI